MTLAPLDDPRYVPQHPPRNGSVPWVVEKWGPRSQLRWFRRFRDSLDASWVQWDRYHRVSVEHLGGHCLSCLDEEEYLGYRGTTGCCCRAMMVSPTS